MAKSLTARFATSALAAGLTTLVSNHPASCSPVVVVLLLTPSPACADMSPSLFKELGSLDTGVLKVTWSFKN